MDPFITAKVVHCVTLLLTVTTQVPSFDGRNFRVRPSSP